MSGLPIARRVLRVTCFADLHNVAQLEIVVEVDGGEARAQRFSFADALQLLEAVDKMQHVGLAMLRHAPRPPAGAAVTCPSCGGHGANPMSDNVNWLPCSHCQGSGTIRA